MVGYEWMEVEILSKAYLLTFASLLISSRSLSEVGPARPAVRESMLLNTGHPLLMVW